MSVLLIGGSPTQPSRSTALLDAVSQRLRTLAGPLPQERLQVRELPAQALLLTDWNNAELARAIAQVESAQAVVIATPVYKAAYSGVLKAFLDLLPQYALRDKAVLPLATGGSPLHMLALDYALRPVLQSMGARHVLPGVYATDAQLTSTAPGSYQINADIALRLDEAVELLVQDGLKLPLRNAASPLTEVLAA